MIDDTRFFLQDSQSIHAVNAGNAIHIGSRQVVTFQQLQASFVLQNSQSVSHSRVTTADILSLRRRVMLLYRDIYTELGIYPETRAAILRSPFGENEFTLPPLDTPQTHCCKL